MKIALRLLANASAMALACALATSAHAQSAQGEKHEKHHGDQHDHDGDKDHHQAQSTALEEIVVTAQKTSGLASKLPVAITAFSADDLKDRGVVDVTTLQNSTPSLNVGSAVHGVNISIRGVSSTDVSSKGEQGVSFNINNIPIGRPQMMGMAFFDLERVEVLRGPQGTLYGKSSTGGAINVITARPKDEFDASASLELGNFNTRRTEAMVNVPVTDTLALRAAASTNSRDGFLQPVLGTQKNINGQRALGDEDNRSGRLSALWSYSEDGSLLATATFGHVGGVTSNMDALYYRVLEKKGAEARKVYANPMAGGLDDDFQNYTVELNHDFGGVQLTYDGARVNFDAHDNFAPSTNDPAGAPGDANYTWQDYVAKIRTDSHELRLSGDTDVFKWVVGANHWKETIDEKDMNWLTLASCAPSLAPSCNSPNPHIVGVTRHKSEGIFGQTIWSATSDLNFTFGLRYSSDSMSRDGYIAGGPPPAGGWKDASGALCAPPNACFGTQADSGAQSAKKVTWRAGADYQLTDGQMLYGSVATGYKSGSFNDVDPTSATHGAGTYGPEKLTAYEVGYKGRLMPNLQFNSSAYYYDYDKYQLTGATFMTPSVTGGSPMVVIYTTLVPAEMYGWENELDWRVTPDDRLNLSMTLAEGKYKDAKVGFLFVNQVDWSDKRIDNLPKFSATLSYEHVWDLPSGSTVTGRVASKYSSGYVVSDLAGDGNPFTGVYSVLPQQYKQGSYTKTDLSLTYATADQKFSLSGYVRNLEDDLQLRGAPQGINPAGVGTRDRTFVRISEPRTYGLRMGIRY